VLRTCDLRVRDVMTAPPETVSEGTTLAEAYLMLSAERLSGAPIVDPTGLLLGVFSTTDLLADLAPVLDPAAPSDPTVLDQIKGARIGDRLDKGAELVTCGEDESLIQACRLMVKNRAHRVIVVDERGAPTAILSAIDVVRAVAALEEVKLGHLSDEPAGEPDARPGL
jgi:CBS domain-containing protein